MKMKNEKEEENSKNCENGGKYLFPGVLKKQYHFQEFCKKYGTSFAGVQGGG